MDVGYRRALGYNAVHDNKKELLLNAVTAMRLQKLSSFYCICQHNYIKLHIMLQPYNQLKSAHCFIVRFYWIEIKSLT